MSKPLKIFLASSAELKDDREDFERFIGRKNKTLQEKGLFIKLEKWEDFIDAMSKTGLQDEYNKAVQELLLRKQKCPTKETPGACDLVRH